MFRRVIAPAFALILALNGCGREVTPSTNTALVSGTMLVRFNTVGLLDFANYRYAIIFNTSGNGQEPYANAYLTSFLNYSFVWIVGAQNGASVSATLDQIFPISNGLGEIGVSVPPSSVQLNTNSNGQNTQFTLQFDRALFFTPVPTSTPTPIAVDPTAVPTTASQNLWNINVFTIDANNNILDAGGLGPNDTSFTLQVDTNTANDNTLPFKKAGAITTASTSAQIAGGEIQNQP
jgi:hypothetical protein